MIQIQASNFDTGIWVKHKINYTVNVYARKWLCIASKFCLFIRGQIKNCSTSLQSTCVSVCSSPSFCFHSPGAPVTSFKIKEMPRKALNSYKVMRVELELFL